MMKKQIWILCVILTLLIVGLSGCTGPPKNGGEPSGYYDGTSGDFHLSPLDTSQPAPEPPITGESKTVYLGDIEIRYYSAVLSNQFMSFGADFFIHLKNTGSETETVYSYSAEEIAPNGEIPNWNMHFFDFQNSTTILEPAEEKTLHYFASMDGEGQFDVSFEFWQNTDKSDKITEIVTFYSSNGRPEFSATGYIYGVVYDKETNQPLNDVKVVTMYYNGREQVWWEETNEHGGYILPVVATSDLETYFGSQELAYDSLTHFVYVEHEGYEYYYKDGVDIERGDENRLDIYLEPISTTETYNLDWENVVSEYHGFFWLNVDDNWKYVLADQAKHPPQLCKATNHYMYNVETGEQMWSFPTGDECWGSAITADGALVALGSHDENVYVINTNDGSLKWSKDSGGMNREVEFSHDGKYLLTGPAAGSGGSNYDFVLYDVDDGTHYHSFSGYDQWLRNSKFTNDDSKFVVGLSGGHMSMLDTDNGNKIWENWVGEFPLFLGVDQDDNTYACGKGRTLFSFDSSGSLRWSYRVPDHTTTSGVISDDGSRLVIGTVGAWVYYIDTSNGDVIWRSGLTESSGTADESINTVGHNAVSISKNGEYIAVGAGPANHLTIYNKKGTKIFEHTSELNTDSILNDKWATIGEGASEGTQKGVMCTVISDNGERVIAGYGDNYIRSFVKQ